MMTRILRHNPVHRFLLISGISLLITLALISTTLALHSPGFALSPLVHAMAGQPLPGPTCQSTHGTQKALCEQQNPQAQGCASDAQSVEVQDAFLRGLLIGEVDLRYSFTCQSYWARTIAYAGAADGTIRAVHARLTFTDATTEETTATPNLQTTSAPVVSFTEMTHGHFSGGSGVFETLGSSQLLTLAL